MDILIQIQVHLVGREGGNLTPFQWEKTSVKSHPKSIYKMGSYCLDVDGEILETGDSYQDYILRYDLMTNQIERRSRQNEFNFSLP